MAKGMQRAVFLDRDGTLNEDPGYISRPEDIHLMPRVGEALFQLKRAGYFLAVVSNQSGVGRGLIQPSALPLIHKRLQELLVPYQVQIDHFELCVHHPNDECECRKPKPKLILDAAKAHNIDLYRSYMVGDSQKDLIAGRSAGCTVALVRTGNGSNTEKVVLPSDVDYIGDDLFAVSNWIVEGNR